MKSIRNQSRSDGTQPTKRPTRLWNDDGSMNDGFYTQDGRYIRAEKPYIKNNDGWTYTSNSRDGSEVRFRESSGGNGVLISDKDGSPGMRYFVEVLIDGRWQRVKDEEEARRLIQQNQNEVASEPGVMQ